MTALPRPALSRAGGTAALGLLSLVAFVGCGSSHTRSAVAPGRCPLTGTPAPGGHVPARAALAVKIGNEPAARPQSGLDAADIVFEEPIEGDITRLLAVYQCQQSSLVGPARSTRWIDDQLLAMFGHPAFAFAGGIDPDMQLVRTSGFVDLNFLRAPTAYHRTSDRVAPDNLYTNTAALWRLAGSGSAPGPVFSYSGAVPAGRPAVAVTAHYSAVYTSGWRWQGGEWAWYVNGAAQANAGVPVTTTNVVVMYVTTHPGPYVEDSLGHHGVRSNTVGSGRALVFRDGRVISCTWQRSSISAPITLTDAHGTVNLAPGRTWVQLVPVTAGGVAISAS